MIFLQDKVRTVIEEAVSAHRGRRWAITTFRDMNEFSSHPSAILSDGSYSVFVKFSGAANGSEQFERELAGLQFLSQASGILIPTPIGNIAVEGGVIMILEGIQAIERTPREWREIGRTLAQIHTVKGNRFGFDTHNYFGPLYQDNRPMQDWASFFIERRLYPRFSGAISAGKLPTEIIQKFEKLLLRIPHLCGPDVAPTLLHGDAQQNNFISTEHGAVAIDPAVYFGHPEMDLAYVDYFHPVPQDIFVGYEELLRIDSGFGERRELWRLYGYLAVVEVEGATSLYLAKLGEAVQKYL